MGIVFLLEVHDNFYLSFSYAFQGSASRDHCQYSGHLFSHVFCCYVHQCLLFPILSYRLLYVFDSHFCHPHYYRLFPFYTEALNEYKLIVMAKLCNILVRFTSDIPQQSSYYISAGLLEPFYFYINIASFTPCCCLSNRTVLYRVSHQLPSPAFL